MRVERFPMPVAQPAAVAENWGSGRYKVTFLDARGLARGGGREFEIDDPKRPTKPAYGNAPSANGQREAAPKQNGQGAAFEAMATGNPFAMFTLMRELQREATREAAQAAQLQIERERVWMQGQIEAERLRHEAMLTLMRTPPPQAPAPDFTAIEERLDELAEAIEERELEPARPGRPDTAVESIAKLALPTLSQIFSSPTVQEAISKRLLGT